MYATTPDTLTPSELAEKLESIYDRMLETADRSDTVAAHTERMRAATQVRLVIPFALGGHIDLGLAWISAGDRMLEAWDRADMDAVHASRSSRRPFLALTDAEGHR
jgi:hypothetical protein